MVPVFNNGASSKPPRNAPTIPTMMLSNLPCWSFVPMIMLATQPNNPPTTIHTMKLMAPLLKLVQLVRKLGVQGACPALPPGSFIAPLGFGAGGVSRYVCRCLDRGLVGYYRVGVRAVLSADARPRYAVPRTQAG